VRGGVKGWLNLFDHIGGYRSGKKTNETTFDGERQTWES